MSAQNRNRAKITAAICLISNTGAFSTLSRSTSFISTHASNNVQKKTALFLRAPPGSGWAEDKDELAYYPETYDPMMEYPGTMRPGSTPENQPFSSLPIQESDPDPVPWPHFQEIEWHHNWGSPHEAPIPMEDFIDMNGRWATAEMEAEMRAGARRGVRERREMEESQKSASFILDDDDEDDEEEDVKIDLGEGVNAFIATADETLPVAAVEEEEVEEEEEEESEEDDSDDFLLDLGLDGGDDDDTAEEEEEEKPAFANEDSTDGILEAMQTMIDAEDSSPEASDDPEIDLNFDDLDLDFGDDEDEDSETVVEGEDEEEFVMIDEDMGEEEDIIPLDDMIENEDMSEDDEFDDGGFDYD